MNESRSGKYQSTVVHTPAVGNAPTLSFTVPAGTVFRGVVSALVRCAIADSPPIFNLQVDGNPYSFHGYQGKSSVGSDYPVTSYVELPAGVYTSAWEILPSASGTNRIGIAGNCYYL